MTHWYAVYTRPHCEKKVADAFLRKKIESYCPVKQAARKWIGQKVAHIPLFPSYVFVRLHESQMEEAKKVEGVINFVWWLGRPAVIRNVEVDMLKRFLEMHKNVLLEKATVNADEMVKLVNDHLIQRDTHTLSVSSGKAKLFLPSLGYTIVSEDEIREVFLNNNIRQQKPPLVNFG